MAVKPLRLAASIALAVLAVVPAGCGTPAPNPVREFATLFGAYDVDYEPEKTPQGLAGRSSLVVQGRIAGIATGRTYGTSATDPIAEIRIVMAVRVGRVLSGSLPADAGDIVYVELPAPLSRPATEFDSAAPKGYDVLLYLRAAAAKDEIPMVDPDAGRPAGQPPYQPTNPQGFVIDTGSSVVQVLNLTEIRNTRLAQFMPGAVAFPEH